MNLATKARLARALNVLSWLALVVALGLQAPRWVRSFRVEGKRLGRMHVTSVDGKREEPLLEPGSPAQKPLVLLFWASWCGPCVAELARFDRAVRAGELPADQIVAVSRDDDPAALARAVEERRYAFRVAWDRDNSLGLALDVRVTPTVAYLKADGEVARFSEGMSLVGVWRAERFLR